MMTLFWINLAVVAGLSLTISLLSRVFGMKSVVEGDKALPYETGMPPLEAGPARMPVLYYRFAVLFVVFDVDLAFLVPWVWLRGSLTLTAMVSMTAFFLLVGFMLTYVWRKGMLTCR